MAWLNRFLIVSVLSAPAAAEEAELPKAHREVLDTMAPIILSQIARHDTDAAVFHGCIDWHSAVHGHWALLRIARVTGAHKEEAAAVEASLTEKGIAAEALLLRANPEFEMPYGRAWFLRLAIEYEEWSGGGKKLRAMADEVAASLVRHFTKSKPASDVGEYANPSWAIAQLHAWMKHAGDEKGLKAVDAWIDGELAAGPREGTFGTDAGRAEFFSRAGNWLYLVAGTRDGKRLGEAIAAAGLTDEALRPVGDVSATAHHLGMNWSRAWALRALATKAPDEADRKRFLAAFEAHVAQGMKHHKQNAGDVWAYDHWVPQFAVYAVTE